MSSNDLFIGFKTNFIDFNSPMDANQSVIPRLNANLLIVDQCLYVCSQFESPFNPLPLRISMNEFRNDLHIFGIQMFPNILFVDNHEVPQTLYDFRSECNRLAFELGQLHLFSSWALNFPGAEPTFNYNSLQLLVNRLEEMVANTPGMTALQTLLGLTPNIIEGYINAFDALGLPNGNH